MKLKKELEEFTHIIKIPVRYNDLDTLGHVNNKAYLSYLEEARIDYHKKVFGWNGKLEFNAVVAKIEINYLKPVYYGDTLCAYTKLSHLGNKSFEITTVFVVKKSENELVKVSDSSVVLVNIDLKTGNPTTITEIERNKLLNFQSSI
ncbi:MAG: thioesterase family protein [Bacteroidota bacterium]